MPKGQDAPRPISTSGEAATLQPPKRIYSLDAFRGIAALSIVFWHWQHFFFSGPVPGSGARPLLEPFLLFYRHGQLAVELFFTLSGFIFFWLYSQPIAERKVGARDFFSRRFSRLVPLHLATLALVVPLQLAYRHRYGADFVYSNNDLLHFIPNLFLVSAWGPHYSHSWNGPIWSVSVEIFLYFLFFALCRTIRMSTLAIAGFSALGLALFAFWDVPVGRGMFAFFLGGCLYRLYARGLESGAAARLARVLPWITATIWIGTLLAVYSPGFPFEAKAGSLPPALFTGLILFPSTILTLAFVETVRGAFGVRTAYLGDLSYSIYLLHFPLQLAFVLGTASLAVDRSYFSQPVALVLFFAVLLPLAWVSYRFLEIPAQRTGSRIRFAAYQQPDSSSGK